MMLDSPVRATANDVKRTRARNASDAEGPTKRRRESAVSNVMERLEVFGALCLRAADEADTLEERLRKLPTAADRRHHAEQIVNAVIALMRGRS